MIPKKVVQDQHLESETETEEEGPVTYDTSKIIEDPSTGLLRFSASDGNTPTPKKNKKTPKTKEQEVKPVKIKLKRKRAPKSPVAN